MGQELAYWECEPAAQATYQTLIAAWIHCPVDHPYGGTLLFSGPDNLQNRKATQHGHMMSHLPKLNYKRRALSERENSYQRKLSFVSKPWVLCSDSLIVTCHRLHVVSSQSQALKFNWIHCLLMARWQRCFLEASSWRAFSCSRSLRAGSLIDSSVNSFWSSMLKCGICCLQNPKKPNNHSFIIALPVRRLFSEKADSQ